jgi:hypothetical protein
MALRVIASYKRWSIVTELQDENSLAVLQSDGRVIATSESAFELLKECSEEVASKLRSQLIENEIAESGGVAKYKELVYQNQLKYGASCYDYLDAATLRAYAELGIYLSSKL